MGEIEVGTYTTWIGVDCRFCRSACCKFQKLHKRFLSCTTICFEYKINRFCCTISDGRALGIKLCLMFPVWQPKYRRPMLAKNCRDAVSDAWSGSIVAGKFAAVHRTLSGQRLDSIRVLTVVALQVVWKNLARFLNFFPEELLIGTDKSWPMMHLQPRLSVKLEGQTIISKLK